MNTIFKRPIKDVKEALNVFCRKNMPDEAVQIALELFESKMGKYVIEKLRIIAVEEKFPTGSQYLPWLNNVINTWKQHSYSKQRLFIIQITTAIANCKGDRHIIYLLRLSEEKTNGSKEELLASKLHYLLVRHKMKSDFPTPQDIPSADLIKKIKLIIFNKENPNPIQQSLWNIFLHYFDKNLICRSFLYTLLAMKFHLHEYLICLEPTMTENIKLTKLSLPDYVFNKYTTKGKELKRGIQHFLENSTPAQPHDDIKTRESFKRKAETFILKNENPGLRKKKRLEFLQLNKFYGDIIVESKLIKTPTATSPGSWIIETTNKYVIYGSYKHFSMLKFQLDIELIKNRFDIQKTNYKVYRDTFYWLYYPSEEAEPVKTNKTYSDDEMHEIIKILIFRAMNECYTELKNILKQDNGTFISINEKKKKKRQDTLLHFFFSKLPSKPFLRNLISYIKTNFDKVDSEFKKYNQSLKNFNLNNINLK